MSEGAPPRTLALEYDEFDPLTAFAKLRTHTPDRAAFLFESHDPRHPGGRISVVGYRVRTGEAYPPAIDAISSVCERGAAQPAADTLAEAIAQSQIGYFSYPNAHTIHGIRHWQGEAGAGSFLSEAAVIVFDHRSARATIASPRPGNLAARCEWELRNAPAIVPLASCVADAVPAGYSAVLPPEKLAARAVRATRFSSNPDDELVLAQMLQVPAGQADPFDVYRGLRELSGAPLTYFVDFGQTPVAPRTCLIGATDTVIVEQHGDDDEGPGFEGLADQLRAAFPHPTVTGSDPVEAAQIIRRVEDWPRDLLGAVVGYAGPGCHALFLLAEQAILATPGAFELPVPLTVSAQSDPASFDEVIRRGASARLAAIRAAQDTAARSD